MCFDGESFPCVRLQEVNSVVCRNNNDGSETPAPLEAQEPDSDGNCPSGEEKYGRCYTCPTGKSHVQNALAQRVRAHARTHAHLLGSNLCVFKSYEKKHHARTNTCARARARKLTHAHTHTHMCAKQTRSWTIPTTGSRFHTTETPTLLT